MDANDSITIRLTAGEWNNVIAVLTDGPFRVVRPLIESITAQALAQEITADARGQPAADEPAKPNAAAHAEAEAAP